MNIITIEETGVRSVFRLRQSGGTDLQREYPPAGEMAVRS